MATCPGPLLTAASARQEATASRISPELNHPLPDMTYKVSGVQGDVTFITDSAGQTVTARVEGLQLGDGGRSGHIQGSVGQSANAEIYTQTPLSDGWRYEGGHLVANGFDGIPERINIVGMLKELNQNIGDVDSFYNFETAVRQKALGVPPPRIDVEINLIRGPGVKTPAKIRVGAWADGELFIDQRFKNIVGSG
ncbi:DNA/RNA non-specific endonuclease [Micrococcaceae bacterium Sec5.7]